MTKADKQAAAKKNRRKQRKQAAVPTSSACTVSGGFRAGKRKRGNSLLKQAPREQAQAHLTRNDLTAILDHSPLADAHVSKSGIVRMVSY